MLILDAFWSSVWRLFDSQNASERETMIFRKIVSRLHGNHMFEGPATNFGSNILCVFRFVLLLRLEHDRSLCLIDFFMVLGEHFGDQHAMTNRDNI